MKQQKSNNNFMTEKEKSFVSYTLTKNLKRQMKHKDYSIFFTSEMLTSSNDKTGNVESKESTTLTKDVKNKSKNEKIDEVAFENKPKPETKPRPKEKYVKGDDNCCLKSGTKNKKQKGSVISKITDSQNNNTCGSNGANKGATKDVKNSKKIEQLEDAINNCDIKETQKPKKQEIQGESKKEKLSLKEILKTSFLRTSRKSRKNPRIIVKKEIELSDKILYKLKIEDLYDKLVIQKYFGMSDEPELLICEDSFFYFLDIPKFFNYSKEFFKIFNDASKLRYLLNLLKYSIKIQDVTTFENFVSKSYENFPILQQEDILKSEFFESFYFNACNVVLAKYLLLSNNNYSCFFYDCLSNDNLELIFSLDYDYAAWQFLAVFIRLLNEDRQAVIVSLVKERVIEAVHSEDEKSTDGLVLFLDAIGIEKKDLQ